MKKPRLCLFGPTLPYRSGIAQYNTQLHKALGKKARLRTITFKRQYPQWLFPGKRDVEEGMDDHREPGVDYLIDVYNPITLKRAADSVSSDTDMVIVTWWTLFWQPGLWYVARRLRKRGIKTIFFVHNLFDHDARGIKRFFSEKFIKQADGYIVQAAEQADLLKEINPAAKILQRIHPIYAQFPGASKKLPKRGRLELLFFGFIRPYKGLDVLIESLELLNDDEVFLTIVGEPWGKIDDLQRRIKKNPNIETRFDYVSDKEAANYFQRADIVVLPYLSATGSGVVTLAYNYGNPVIASRVGGLNDAVIHEKTGWLVEPGSARQLAERIKEVKREELSSMKPAIGRFCENNSWDALADSICEFSDLINQD